jgi:hypothetical protein
LDLQGGKYLVILARDGLELPEEVWGPRLLRSLSEFTVEEM